MDSSEDKNCELVETKINAECDNEISIKNSNSNVSEAFSREDSNIVASDINYESGEAEINANDVGCNAETSSSKDDSNAEDLPKEDMENVVSTDITPEKDGGVLKKILKEGEGEEYPGYGDRVSVHYTGWLLGKEAVEFDSSRKGEKFEFSLDKGQVIKGWDLGISTMKKGEIAVFICHPRYAYGDMGYPPAIPPFTPLIFEIELFGWRLDDLSPKKDDTIQRKVLEKGDGNVFPNEGSQVKVRFIQYDEEEPFDEVEKDFILGEGSIVDIPEGLELALFKFHLKEKSYIYLRKKYAEDALGQPAVDPNSEIEVKYEVTLLDFQKAKEIWEMNSDEKFEKAKLSKKKGVEFFEMGNYKLALKQFRWIVTCLENEPGVSAETQEIRKPLLLSGYLNIALCQQKLKNHLDVIKVCNKVLALDPNNEKALFRRGQAKVQINDCEEALQDFESLCSIKPDNKAAQNYVIICQNKMKKQNMKDKGTYNKMFELFVKQDEERMKNMKTETGVWEGDGNEEGPIESKKDGLNESNSALLNANVIEISNTANGNISF